MKSFILVILRIVIKKNFILLSKTCFSHIIKTDPTNPDCVLWVEVYTLWKENRDEIFIEKFTFHWRSTCNWQGTSFACLGSIPLPLVRAWVGFGELPFLTGYSLGRLSRKGPGVPLAKRKAQAPVIHVFKYLSLQCESGTNWPKHSRGGEGRFSQLVAPKDC